MGLVVLEKSQTTPDSSHGSDLRERHKAIRMMITSFQAARLQNKWEQPEVLTQ